MGLTVSEVIMISNGIIQSTNENTNHLIIEEINMNLEVVNQLMLNELEDFSSSN